MAGFLRSRHKCFVPPAEWAVSGSGDARTTRDEAAPLRGNAVVMGGNTWPAFASVARDASFLPPHLCMKLWCSNALSVTLNKHLQKQTEKQRQTQRKKQRQRHKQKQPRRDDSDRGLSFIARRLRNASGRLVEPAASNAPPKAKAAPILRHLPLQGAANQQRRDHSGPRNGLKRDTARPHQHGKPSAATEHAPPPV